MQSMPSAWQHASASLPTESRSAFLLKDFLRVAALAAISISNPALAGDVGASVSSSQPSFYGRLDIGDYPPPQVINRQAIAIESVPIDRPPIYLRVPPGHAKHWRKHCHQYNACGERVLFVHDKWYSREHVPHDRAQHPKFREPRKGDQPGRLKNDHDDHARNHAY
jgi:hypothetical protein